MDTFYSILYAIITPETSERISLGLILGNGQKTLFRYSKAKLSALTPLVSGSQHDFIGKYLNSVCSYPGKINGLPEKPILEFVEPNQSSVSENYINYLSNYNQNLLTFGAPVKIDVQVTEEILNKLFVKLINERIKPTVRKTQLIRTKELFIPKAKKFYTIDRQADPDEFPELIMPVKVDFFGKNEIPVYAQVFDFERALNHVKNSYFDIKQLQDAIKGKGFVISTEPDQTKYSNQHQAWNSLRKSNVIEYVDKSEIEKLEIYAIEHGVVPE